jgi:AraC-like DNA-binding protein
MRARFQFIRLPESGSIQMFRAVGRSFTSFWHFHPEIEVKFVERSRGVRLVGDSMLPFREGDLVVTGPNLPHVWINDPAGPHELGYACALIAQFREDFLGAALGRTPEFAAVADLLQRSRQGLLFEGSIAAEAGNLIRDAGESAGLPRLLALLQSLNLLANAKTYRVLTSADYRPRLNQSDAHRINLACRFIQENLTGEVSRPAVAALVKMNEDAFSRFFHHKMGNTFSNYVNQLRVARAVHLMVEESKSVTEACYASGFNNLSNFNRRFRMIKGMTPTRFIEHLKAAT